MIIGCDPTAWTAHARKAEEAARPQLPLGPALLQPGHKDLQEIIVLPLSDSDSGSNSERFNSLGRSVSKTIVNPSATARVARLALLLLGCGTIGSHNRVSVAYSSEVSSSLSVSEWCI